jgi:hypothetical protein
VPVVALVATPLAVPVATPIVVPVVALTSENINKKLGWGQEPLIILPSWSSASLLFHPMVGIDPSNINNLPSASSITSSFGL